MAALFKSCGNCPVKISGTRRERPRSHCQREIKEECDLELLAARQAMELSPFMTSKASAVSHINSLRVYRLPRHNPQDAKAVENDGIQWGDTRRIVDLSSPGFW